MHDIQTIKAMNKDVETYNAGQRAFILEQKKRELAKLQEEIEKLESSAED